MERMAPTGPVYQAGTLSGNPLATAAGNAQLAYLEREDPFPALESTAARLVRGILEALEAAGIPATGTAVGSMWGVFFHPGPVRSFEEAREADTELFARYHRAALERGVFFAPSPFEAGFVSVAHGDEELKATLEAVAEAARVAVEEST